MSQMNPYAAPTVEPQGSNYSSAHGSLRIENGCIVVPASGAVLPRRCAKCNGPAFGEPLRVKVSWHPTWVYLLVMINIIVYAVVGSIMRKTTPMEFSLCEEHMLSRKRALWVGLGGLIGGPILLIAAGAAMDSDTFIPVMLLGMVGILGSILYMAFGRRVLTPRKIDKVEAHLKAGEAFVASLR